MKELNAESLESEIKEGVSVIDFWAPWCGPCRAMAPVFEEVAKQMPEQKFAKINVEEHAAVGQKYNISSIPCFIVFKDGEEIGRIIGGMDEESFKQKVTELL